MRPQRGIDPPRPNASQRERHILERAVHTIAEQAAKADDLVDEATTAGGASHPVTVRAKMLRLELLKVKADLDREFELLRASAVRETDH